ncbi:SAM-dependent methyltransferase [Acaryochloris marina]|uniref:SAM-dependent methyltransferase n=1 Tax=Acaryochloris marina (strain MBIC 11017) TaxID=329726 RepID=B0CEV7_ACAM1|nr:SAM-dependent methyltransferase [Acaryochloris marina]ABW29354.1 SAM-dependent methyltransferase [Acaryochloris marina MBIC11017]BDM78273.1 SAM-dependent methyltransferase [Acaryochloris marina MBIC10699]
MAIQLNSVVPFGRSRNEYIKMFNLTAADLGRSILGAGDGPASFNAESTPLGSQIISVDPIYELSGAAIQQRFETVLDDIINQVKATPQDWVWSYHSSPEDLRHNRIQAMQNFLQDYELGKQQKRYQTAALPTLPFPNQTFELALCSHFLFLYSQQYDVAFHLAAIRELLRISAEVRIFPLLTLMLKPSPYIQPVIQACQDWGYVASIETVGYELQKGGNQMLVIHTP